MWFVRCRQYTWFSLLLTLLTPGPQLTLCEGKVSDACHGLSEVPQTHNKLECDEGTQICITEVRYYQYDPRDPTYSWQISEPVPDRCCRHNVSRCSWIKTEPDERAELQRRCSGQRKCDLHSLRQADIEKPCLNLSDFSSFSNVRAITYTCSSSGTCSSKAYESTVKEVTSIANPGNISAATTTKREISTGPSVSLETQTSLEESTEDPVVSTSSKDNTPVIIGCVVAFIAVVVIITTTVVLVRRRFKNPKPSEVSSTADADSQPNMPPRQESAHSYYNISLRDLRDQTIMTGGANNPVARNRVNPGAHVTRTLNMDTPNIPMDTATSTSARQLTTTRHQKKTIPTLSWLKTRTID